MEPSILLVDHEAFLIEPLQMEFGAGRIILVASSIEFARKVLSESPLDIVIIDADLSDAVDFINEIRAGDHPVMLISLTGSTEQRDRLQRLGIETIILKREGPQPVLQAVRHYGESDELEPEVEQVTKVLVVDDERDFLKLFSRMLALWGYSALIATDGDEALKLFEQQPDIAIVLLDIRLPGRGGLEVLREIQKRSPRTGVIVLSGLADREIARQAMKFGAFDYVTKPPDFPILHSTIVACLSHVEYQSQSWWKRLLG